MIQGPLLPQPCNLPRAILQQSSSGLAGHSVVQCASGAQQKVSVSLEFLEKLMACNHMCINKYLDVAIDDITLLSRYIVYVALCQFGIMIIGWMIGMIGSRYGQILCVPHFADLQQRSTNNHITFPILRCNSKLWNFNFTSVILPQLARNTAFQWLKVFTTTDLVAPADPKLSPNLVPNFGKTAACILEDSPFCWTQKIRAGMIWHKKSKPQTLESNIYIDPTGKPSAAFFDCFLEE